MGRLFSSWVEISSWWGVGSMAAEFIFLRAEGLSSFKQETPWGAGGRVDGGSQWQLYFREVFLFEIMSFCGYCLFRCFQFKIIFRPLWWAANSFSPIPCSLHRQAPLMHPLGTTMHREGHVTVLLGAEWGAWPWLRASPCKGLYSTLRRPFSLLGCIILLNTNMLLFSPVLNKVKSTLDFNRKI